CQPLATFGPLSCRAATRTCLAIPRPYRGAFSHRRRAKHTEHRGRLHLKGRFSERCGCSFWRPLGRPVGIPEENRSRRLPALRRPACEGRNFNRHLGEVANCPRAHLRAGTGTTVALTRVVNI